MYRTLLARCEYKTFYTSFIMRNSPVLLYSHLAKQGAVHFSPMRNVKFQFLRSKNFNIFYDFGPEKFSERQPRAPTQPEKNPISEKKIFISEVKIRTSEVENLEIEAKKRREPPVYGLSPLRCYKDTIFSREMQIALTFRNTPPNVKMQRFAADGLCDVLYYEGEFLRNEK